jgi:predicted CopG family antitoxin
MRTIEISDAVYQEILSRRKGRETISKTLERELMQSKIEGDINRLDADITRSEKTKRYSSEQMKERLGLQIYV